MYKILWKDSNGELWSMCKAIPSLHSLAIRYHRDFPNRPPHVNLSAGYGIFVFDTLRHAIRAARVEKYEGIVIWECTGIFRMLLPKRGRYALELAKRDGTGLVGVPADWPAGTMVYETVCLTNEVPLAHIIDTASIMAREGWLE